MIPEPHGGHLVERLIQDAKRVRLESELASLPRVEVAIDQLFDLAKIGVGAYSPLEGFMDSATLASVLEKGRLLTGLPWSLPILLPVNRPEDRTTVERLRAGEELALVDHEGSLRGILRFEERVHFDPSAVARSAYGTVDPTHPNVGELLRGSDFAVAGPVDAVANDPRACTPGELTPRGMRELFQSRGWKNVAAYQCRNPPHTAHEYIQRLTLEREDVDALLIHPIVGRLKTGDYRPEVILRAYEALVKGYCPAERVLLNPLTISMRYAGPKAALFLAIVRKNYGCSHYIVGRDQAGVGKFYDPYACHRIFDQFDVGVVPLRYEESFYCRSCQSMASTKTCPHPPAARVDTSQTRIRKALQEGGEIPVELLRPEVAVILRQPNVILREGDS
ncbi:MAG: sulfate adenylyltransferase [Thermoplasmata archaeon]